MSQTQIAYPLDKEQAGKHSWVINHHLAALYPIENPTEKEKERMKTTILTNMTAVSKLCKNCKMDIKAYLRQNPINPALVGRSALSIYLCNFHNYVKKKTGKPLEVEKCENILRDIPVCKDCEVSVAEIKAKDTVSVTDLKGSLEKFKDVSVNVFKALCKKYNLPTPNFKFHHCPDNPETSCTIALVDKNTNDVVERPVIYLHPNVYGLRTIVHEFIHYAKQMNKVDDISEYDIEKETQNLIDREFPYDKLELDNINRLPVSIPAIRHDSFSPTVPKKRAIDNFPNASKIFDKYLAKDSYSYRNRQQQQDQDGDLVFDFVNEIMGQGQSQNKDKVLEQEYRNEQHIKSEMHNNDDDLSSVLSGLDVLYKPFEGILGIKANDINRGQTPVILGNAVMSLVESNFTQFGSLLFSLLTSTGMYTGLALGKNQMTYGDRVLLNGLASVFMWTTFGYMNPKVRDELIGDAMGLGQAISQQDWGTVQDYIIDSPFLPSTFSGQSEISKASPQSATRSAQRASSGGGGGSGRSSSSGSAASRQQRQQERLGLVSGRNLQKAVGLATPPIDPRTTRDVVGGANPQLARVIPEKRNTFNPFYDDDDDTVYIPSDENLNSGGEGEIMEYEGAAESSFGMKVAGGAGGGRLASSNYDESYLITDPDYSNSTYYAEEEMY